MKNEYNPDNETLPIYDPLPPDRAERSPDTSGHELSPVGAIKRSTLSIENIHKFYGRKEVVRGISFQMTSGEVVGFLGPNGAGKTTVFYSVVGFIRPNIGSIFLDGVNITHHPMNKRARAGIAYLPQEASVFRKLTVEQNILAVLETRSDLNRKQRYEHLDFLLGELGLDRRPGLRKQPAYTLSGGERRRTEIARSLALEPKFLLLDEPFAGIDPIAVKEIKDIIELLKKKGIGVLITDHNVRDTLSITDRAFIVQDGQIMVSGTKEDIMNNALAREVYLGEHFTM